MSEQSNRKTLADKLKKETSNKGKRELKPSEIHWTVNLNLRSREVVEFAREEKQEENPGRCSDLDGDVNDIQLTVEALTLDVKWTTIDGTLSL